MPNPETHSLPVALLVIDMQPGFLKVVPQADALQKRVAFILLAAKLLGIPCCLTEQVPDKLGATTPQLQDAAGAAPVFTKTAFSALRADGIQSWLQTTGVEHVLIAGIETPICVYQSVVDALADDLDITLLSDAIGARRPADATAAISEMIRAGAHHLPAESVFFAMMGDAADARFRDFSRLVKEANT